MPLPGLDRGTGTVSPFYDEVFSEVQQRISVAGSAGKADIAMPSFWKRLRADTMWVPRLLALPDPDVRKCQAGQSPLHATATPAPPLVKRKRFFGHCRASRKGQPWLLPY